MPPQEIGLITNISMPSVVDEETKYKIHSLRVSTSDMASLIASNMFQLLCYILPELHIVRALTLPKSTSLSLKVRNRCSLKLHLFSYVF